MTTPDFYELRRQGIGFIAEMGGDLWTDYNTHDPGITILEAAGYAITELSYRTALPMADLLASAAPSGPVDEPYPGQPFPTARQILTINPVTPDDFRRLLIDLAAVRNAWVSCRSCACDAGLSVRPRGLYDVALELEGDEVLGDLNDRKLTVRRTVYDAFERPHALTVEVRFPSWKPGDHAARTIFLSETELSAVTVTGPARSQGDGTPVDAETLRRNWRGAFTVDLEIELADHRKLTIERAALRLYGDRAAREESGPEELRKILADAGPGGLVGRYRRRMIAANKAVAAAKETLERHRNLDEDYCHVRGIEIEDVAVCADVEIRPDADVEQVQASVWFEIERYLSPPIGYHFVDELLTAGTAVEDIFNGPEMTNGYVDAAELAAAGLRTVIRVSDIIDRLMEIPGVLTVENVLLTAYDDDSLPIRGTADQAWTLAVTAGRRPSLYRELSRFRFTAGGLPFVPRPDEAEGALTQLRGAAARPKLHADNGDVPVPVGAARDLGSYFPLQHGFPLTYGIGPAGLPSAASALRRAQAKQLKAYLLIFEQVLRNAYAQVAHASDLFSLDEQEHTYFTEAFTDEELPGYATLVNGLDPATLAGLAESAPEFAARRNRFLDHLLARFGEQFGEYAMLLTSVEGHRTASLDLIADKAAFLRAHPKISHDRGRAANRAEAPCMPGNKSGLERRVSLLLGYPDLALVWEAHSAPGAPGYEQLLALRDRDGNQLLSLTPPATLTAAFDAFLAARGPIPGDWRIVLDEGQLVLEAAGSQRLLRRGAAAETLDVGDVLADVLRAILANMAASEELDDGLRTWSANERAILVEHLLLRPKFPGDAIYPDCGTCAECGAEDPYSFRLTYVLPGWSAPFNTDMQMRRFAERTIAQETPAHLIVKTCWVGSPQFERFEDAWCRWLRADARIDWTTEALRENVTAILAGHLAAGASASPEVLCRRTSEILAFFGAEFADWRDSNVRAGTPPAAFTPGPVPLGADPAFHPDTAEAVRDFLLERYMTYREVSYRLQLLVDALGTLRNTYPGATLHDCDEGGDRNPIRLNQTALGSNTR